MPISNKVFENLFIQAGVPEGTVKSLAAKGERENRSLPDLLLNASVISKEDFDRAIKNGFGVDVVDFQTQEINKEALAKIPKDMALEKEAIPFALDNDSLFVGMTNPSDLDTIEYLRKRSGLSITPYFITQVSFSKGILEYKQDLQEAISEMIRKSEEITTEGEEDVEKAANQLSVIELFDTIAEYAVIEGVSDIHFEPLEHEVLVRYRVDGILEDVSSLPKSILPILIARIKILSNLKIDEHRLPQDGRIKIEVNKQPVSLRISVLPTYFGEKIVARVLDEGSKQFTLEDLGFVGNNLKRIRMAMKRPHGMILSTGPTGSGKTTTLYTILSFLNTPKVNINTVEDPIEYAMPRVNQMQIQPNIGLNFADGLRALLRQDPDIIMVGEIRDQETAGIAVNAALTGHLVLSTVHTNDAAGAIPRLIDMGVEEFLLASSVNLIIAQRLVRKICPHCKEEEKLTADQIASLKGELEKAGASSQVITQLLGNGIFYKGKGCKRCGESGYKGRIGIYEVLEISPVLIDAISSKSNASQIEEIGRKEGMELMTIDGMRKAKEGVTSISEVLRVIRE